MLSQAFFTSASILLKVEILLNNQSYKSSILTDCLLISSMISELEHIYENKAMQGGHRSQIENAMDILIPDAHHQKDFMANWWAMRKLNPQQQIRWFAHPTKALLVRNLQQLPLIPFFSYISIKSIFLKLRTNITPSQSFIRKHNTFIYPMLDLCMTLNVTEMDSIMLPWLERARSP